MAERAEGRPGFAVSRMEPQEEKRKELIIGYQSVGQQWGRKSPRIFPVIQGLIAEETSGHVAPKD